MTKFQSTSLFIFRHGDQSIKLIWATYLFIQVGNVTANQFFWKNVPKLSKSHTYSLPFTDYMFHKKCTYMKVKVHMLTVLKHRLQTYTSITPPRLPLRSIQTTPKLREPSGTSTKH